MAKLVLNSISNISGNPTSAETNINANFAAIVAQVELLLSRDGETPNLSLANQDMNSKRILNLGEPRCPTDAARLQDVTGDGEFHCMPAGGTTGQALVKATGTDYDVEWDTISGGGGSGSTIAIGAVSSSGNLQSGSIGIESVSKEDTGEYLITFADGFFSGAPIISVSCWVNDSDKSHLSFTNPSSTEVTVLSTAANLSTPQDTPFHITAIKGGS